MIQKSLHIFAFQYSKQTDENGTTLDYQYCGPAQRNKHSQIVMLADFLSYNRLCCIQNEVGSHAKSDDASW